MNDLPNGWDLTSFGSICGTGQYGWTSAASNQGEVKYLRTTDITKGQIDWNSVPYCQEVPTDIDKYRVQANDILISRAGSVGFSALISDIPFLTLFASYLIRFVPSKQIEPHYVEYFLRSSDYWRQISEASSGIALANVNAKKLSEIEVPLSPINEQQRIVAKLDRLFAHSRRTREELEHIPKLIKRYKQAILAAAISGKLTENCEVDSNNSSANETVFLSSALLDLKTGPFGSVLHKSDYVTGGIPIVNPMHINDGKITPLAEMTISGQKAEQLSDFILQQGDVIIARRGVIGRCAVVQAEEDGWICGTGSMILRPKPELLPQYLQIFLSSPATIETLTADAVGSTMVNLNQRGLLSLEIWLPSLKKQKEIIRRVEKMFKSIESIEEQYQQARQLCDRLEQATLAKAFRGELVPQDPNDEPASVLLERICAEKQQPVVSTGKKSRRKTA